MTKNEIFIEKSISIHGDRYDYSNINYINNLTKVEIICKEHGSFFQKPRDHINNCGCRSCGLLSIKNSKVDKDWLDDFIKQHSDRYDYNKSVYISAKDKVEIICKEHGSFFQRVIDHKRGYGCNKCGIIQNALNRRNINWLDDFIKVHGDKYDYSKSEYITKKTKIEIVCNTHGSFFQTPSSHKSGSGCPKCKISKGENKIMELLLDNKISFNSQHTFDGCKLKHKLLFDFYLPDFNVCVEYDGIQHFEAIDYFGGSERLKLQKIKDNIKNKWCETNNIKLIRISYKDYDNIHDILNFLFLVT